jgi:hypothetical protein
MKEIGGMNGEMRNTCGSETEEKKETDHFVDDKRMRGKYYDKFERNRL